jgi:hypothetical protein
MKPVPGDLPYYLYIGDANEESVVEWLCENLSPIVLTTRAEHSLTDMYHGDCDLWILNTQDVSDIRSRYDNITMIRFLRDEDRLLCQLTWGGTHG